jgi:hypothetical protein
MSNMKSGNASYLTQLERITRKWEHITIPKELEIVIQRDLLTLKDCLQVLARDCGYKVQPSLLWNKHLQLEEQFSDATKKCFLVGFDYYAVHKQQGDDFKFSEDESALIRCAIERVMSVFLGLFTDKESLDRNNPLLSNIYELIITSCYQSYSMGLEQANT